MNKLFDVYNTRGRRGWIAAPSAKRAAELAIAHRWGQAKNIKVVVCSDTVRRDGYGREFDGWDELVQGPEGQVALALPMETWADLLAQIKGQKQQSDVGRFVVVPFGD